MFKGVDAKSIKEYIENMPEDRREIIEELDAFIKKTVPKLEPYFAYNMLGYGKFEYFDKSAKEYKPWPIVAMANQKNYISIYVCGVDGHEYLAEKYESELGKVNIGKSCIRFKKLENLDLKGLKKVLKAAEKSPGMVGAETKK